jgi:acetyltransferase-like isoleucine patch superfamily enzyme
MRKNPVKNIFKKIVKNILIMLKPVVERLAVFYGIEIRKKYKVYGQNDVIFEDKETERRFVPKSTHFNTRSGNIYIGKNAMFGENVMVLTGKHLSIDEAKDKDLPEHSFPMEGRDIKIGRGCFIGSGAIINGKVKIGDHSVVAGSVVTKDIPERVFAAGVPAKIIRRF